MILRHFFFRFCS